MEREKAYQIWETIFNDREVAYDFASHPMKKEDYQNENSYYGWDINVKQPFLVREDNYLPCSLNTISFRSGKSTFKVGNHLFEVRKGKKYGTFSIYDITDRNNPLNMEPTEETQDPEFNKKRFHEIATSYKGKQDQRFFVPTMSSIAEHVFEEKLEDADVVDNFYKEEKDEENQDVEEQLDFEETEEIDEEFDNNNQAEEEIEEPIEEEVGEEIVKEEQEANELVDDNEIKPLDEPKEEKTFETQLQNLSNRVLIEDDDEDALEELAMANSYYQEGNPQREEELPPLVLDLQNENKAKEKEIESLKEELNQVKQEKNDTIQSILSVNETLKNKIQELTLDVQNEQTKNETLNEEKNSLEEELNLVKGTNEELSHEINRLQTNEAQQTLLLDEKNELQNKINSLEEKNENLRLQVQELENKPSYLNELTLEKENHQNEIRNYVIKDEQYQEEIRILKEETERIKANYDQLDAQTEMTDGQIASLSTENQELNQKLEKVNEEFDQLKKENENIKLERDFYREKIKDKNKTEEVVSHLEEKLKAIEEELSRKNARIDVLNSSVIQLENKNMMDAQKIESINAENQNKENEIQELKEKNEDYKNLILFLNLGGNETYYEEAKRILLEQEKPFDYESLLSLLDEHSEWKIKEEKTVHEIRGVAEEVLHEDLTALIEQNQRKEKAMNYYAELFGEEKIEVSDFAGRYIRLNDYGDRNSAYGWDYSLLNPGDIETKENVFIAHYRTIKDYRYNEIFESNNHKYQVVKEDGKNKIKSAEFITDPYDFSQALRVTRNNLLNKSPLVYLFVKVVGVNTSEPNFDSMMEFFDLIDRTVKRCCPISFIEMKTVVGNGRGNYAFITFDGNQSEVYREVNDYAVLLNSYRREYRKENRLNAVIVLNEVDVPFSKRHLDYDALVSETKDDELRALRYEFNMTVINSLIKRTIHIGPRILDKLPLDQNLLKPSQIGQGNYALMYRFDREFKVYNFVYALSNIKEENQE